MICSFVSADFNKQIESAIDRGLKLIEVNLIVGF